MKKITVRTKLLMGFFCVVALTVLLAAFGIYTLQNVSMSYDDVLNFPQKRLESILDVKAHVVDIRRVATAINAYVGDVERQQGYQTESADIVTKINNETDVYIGLMRADNNLDETERREIVEKAESLKTVLAHYKAELIDVNIQNAMMDDKQAVLEVAAKNAPLIASLSSTIEELTQWEQSTAQKMSEETTQLEKRYMMNFMIIAAIISVISVIIALIISRGITKPVGETQAALTALAKGTFDVLVRGNYSGEFADMKDAMNKTVSEISSYIKELSEILESISKGNLTSTIQREYVGEFSQIKQSINMIVDRLGGAMSEVRDSTIQVAEGSKRIADGAQSLAQGSSQQQSVVEKLSATIGEIAEKTKQNAGIAKKAEELSANIRDSAEKGSTKMEQMVQSVKDINDASNKIEKVIKVIDDIAFQTNILALNAAVEAARAGSSGSGFAVVAAEVRSLAAKSADAAKDTGEMIENSIRKANMGLSMATETSASLKEIVEGINQSAELVSKIALSSDEQTSTIEQINTGIDQVSLVVQQNSAVAEQSAAASQEMSSQADTLEKLTGQFMLNTNRRQPSLANYDNQQQTGSLSFTLPDMSEDYGKY